MSASMRFAATGDSFITRRLPETPELARLAALIQGAEARFTNLEVVTPGSRGFPNAVSGGTWAKAPRAVIGDLQKLGFNLFAWANNHTLDYSYGGLAATREALDAHGAVHAGVGDTLAEAARPRYLDCPSGRVALIAATSTFHECWLAGHQRPDSPGRPGINPLRFTTTYSLPPDRLALLQALAAEAGINAPHEQRVKEGFAKPCEDGVTLFGHHRFEAGESGGWRTAPHAADVARILAAIGEARRQADFALVSLHAHESGGTDKTVPADFIRDFAHCCIEAGAHAIIGHGPHVLRGIELHQGRPIFYSLGNFIFQNETIETLPQDFYDKQGLGWTENVADAIDARSAGNTRGFVTDARVWQSVMPLWRFEEDRLVALDLVPIELGFGNRRPRLGTPSLSRDRAILDQLAALSAPFGVTIKAEAGIGTVLL